MYSYLAKLLSDYSTLSGRISQNISTRLLSVAAVNLTLFKTSDHHIDTQMRTETISLGIGIGNSRHAVQSCCPLQRRRWQHCFHQAVTACVFSFDQLTWAWCLNAGLVFGIMVLGRSDFGRTIEYHCTSGRLTINHQSICHKTHSARCCVLWHPLRVFVSGSGEPKTGTTRRFGDTRRKTNPVRD